MPLTATRGSAPSTGLPPRPGGRPSAPPPAPARGRRRALPILAVALAALASAPRPSPARAAGIDSPIVSGLPWRSGAKAGDCLARLRRPLDVNHLHLVHESFAKLVEQSGSAPMRREAAAAPLWAVTVPLLTDDARGQFARCAAGAFDHHFRRIGANLRGAGARDLVVRLGHEANLGSAEHAWGADTAAQARGYVACWRRAAAQLRRGAPGLRLDWSSAKKTRTTAFRTFDLYPGDDVVDVIGVHYYDSDPRKSTQALWDRYYDATYNGGPWGLGAWLAEARARRKRLSVGEWGVWRRPGDAAAEADDPVYVYNMYRFFRINAGSVAYETYQNSQPEHRLCPATPFPEAAAWYEWAWGSTRGRPP